MSTHRNTARKIAIFRGLFSGRADAYGTYDPETGRVYQVKEPVTDEVILAHLQGRRPYGVYLLDRDRTRAVVADFDTDDAWAPIQFEAAARQYGVASYIERSKAKGFHVWIFFTGDGVPAWKARRVVGRILTEIEKPTVEVFPKHDAVREGVAFGNFINAPLFGRLVPLQRTVFVHAGDPTTPHRNQWDVLEQVVRIEEQLLDEIIEINELGGPLDGNGAHAKTRPAREHCSHGLTPCAQRMLADGVTERQRVSCFRLAVQLKRAGLPYASAVAVLNEWSVRNRPSDGKRIITEREVASQAACAFDKGYRACGCEDPAIQPFCEASCPVGKAAGREIPRSNTRDEQQHE